MVVKHEQNRTNWLSYCCSLFLVTVCAVTYAADLYFNIAYSHPNLVNHRYGNQTPRQLVNNYLTQITPSSWVFIIWIVLYALLALWFVYVFYLVCCRQLFSRRNKSSLFPAIFWFLFIIVNVLNAVWIYCFIQRQMVLSGVILLILLMMLYLLNMMAFRTCWFDVTCCSNYNKNDMECDDEVMELSYCEVLLLRLLTLNVFPFYAMWFTLTACWQWAMIFKYFLFNWSDNVSCIVSLSILTVLLLIYWNMDLMVYRKYFACTWLSHFCLIVGLIAILIRQGSIGGVHKPGLFFAFILLLVSGLVANVKSISLCFWRPKYENLRFSRV